MHRTDARAVTARIEYQLIRATELLFMMTLAVAFVHIFASFIFPEPGKAGVRFHDVELIT